MLNLYLCLSYKKNLLEIPFALPLSQKKKIPGDLNPFSEQHSPLLFSLVWPKFLWNFGCLQKNIISTSNFSHRYRNGHFIMEQTIFLLKKCHFNDMDNIRSQKGKEVDDREREKGRKWGGRDAHLEVLGLERRRSFLPFCPSNAQNRYVNVAAGLSSMKGADWDRWKTWTGKGNSKIFAKHFKR